VVEVERRHARWSVRIAARVRASTKLTSARLIVELGRDLVASAGAEDAVVKSQRPLEA
jgi:hypothetical protein